MGEPEVQIGRLRKRIAKLQKQRDHFRERCVHYAEIVRLHPYMERQYESLMQRRKEHERVKGLEERVKEQAILIGTLLAAAEAKNP